MPYPTATPWEPAHDQGLVVRGSCSPEARRHPRAVPRDAADDHRAAGHDHRAAGRDHRAAGRDHRPPVATTEPPVTTTSRRPRPPKSRPRRPRLWRRPPRPQRRPPRRRGRQQGRRRVPADGHRHDHDLAHPSSPGATVVITFTGCNAGEMVTISMNGITVTVTCNGPSGSVRMPMAAGLPSATASMTAPTKPGSYPVTARGLTSGVSAAGTLSVLSRPAQACRAADPTTRRRCRSRRCSWPPPAVWCLSASSAVGATAEHN